MAPVTPHEPVRVPEGVECSHDEPTLQRGDVLQFVDVEQVVDLEGAQTPDDTLIVVLGDVMTDGEHRPVEGRLEVGVVAAAAMLLEDVRRLKHRHGLRVVLEQEVGRPEHREDVRVVT